MNRKNPLEAIYAEKGAACSENKCFPGKGHLKLNNPLSFILFYFILVFLCNYTINNSLQKSVNMGQMVRGSYSALFLSILVTYLIKMGPSVTFKKRYLFSDNFSIVHMKKKSIIPQNQTPETQHRGSLSDFPWNCIWLHKTYLLFKFLRMFKIKTVIFF